MNNKLSEPSDNITDTLNSLRGWKQLAEAAEKRISALLAELEAKDKRIADLEAGLLNSHHRLINTTQNCSEWERKAISNFEECATMSQHIEELQKRLATPVRLPEKFSMLHRTDFYEDYHSTMAFKSVEVFDAIRAAGFTFTVGDE